MRTTNFLISVLIVLFVLPLGGPLWADRQAQSDELGAQDHPQILAQFGGEIQNRDLSKYVAGIGHRLTEQTDESNERWTFTVLDSPVVNAFALPGGYVYVTRGLLAIANNEAELAGVLGHEIGHVLSGHGEQRVKRSNQVGIGVVIGTILGGLFGGSDGAADAIELGAKLGSGYLAQHSQSEELEADTIGVRLLADAGYDPFAQADFLKQLTAKEALESKIAGQQHNPNRIDFFASHPATANRTKKAIKAAENAGMPNGGASLKEQAYLQKIDGIIYGDTPREGFIRGLTFSHPELKFTFTVPQGFILQNASQQVMAANQKGAQIILSGDELWTGSMDRYLTQRWALQISRETALFDLRDVRTMTINGLDAAMALVNINGPNGVRVAQLTAIRFDGATMRFVALTDKADGKSRNALNTSSQTFRPISTKEAARLKPYRLRISTVRHGDTIANLSQGMPLTGFQEEQFRAMNGYIGNRPMEPGDLVKIVE